MLILKQTKFQMVFNQVTYQKKNTLIHLSSGIVKTKRCPKIRPQ